MMAIMILTLPSQIKACGRHISYIKRLGHCNNAIITSISRRKFGFAVSVKQALRFDGCLKVKMHYIMTEKSISPYRMCKKLAS